MPVTVEIDGLGKVELDDSFKSKSAAEQEQIISDIVAQARPQSHGGGGVTRNRSAPETYAVLERLVTQLYPQARITSDKRTPEHNREVGGVEDSYHVSGHGIDVTGLSADERANLKSELEAKGIKFDEFMYHRVKGGGLHLHMASTHVPEELFADPHPTLEAPPEGQDAPPADTPPAPGKPSGQPPANAAPKGPEESWGHSIASGAHDLVKGIGEGFTDFQNDATGLLLRGTDAIGLTEGSHDRFDRAREEVEDPAQDARYVHPDGWSRTIGNIGGNVMAGAPLAELKPLQALGAASKAGLVGDLAIQGAAGGAITSGGNDIAQNAAIGAVAAPALYGAAKAVGAAAPEARATRFANKQAKDNPDAAFDAEIWKDLRSAIEKTAVSPTDKPSRYDIVVKAVNAVEGSYKTRYGQLIDKLGLPEMENLKLKAALDKRYSLEKADIDALRGTVPGDAVADAIIKTQRLRKLTEPNAPSGGGLSKVLKVAGLAADITPGVPGYVGRSLQFAGRGTAPEVERVRAAKASKLLAQRGYEKLGDLVGPSGQHESQQALWDAAEAAVKSKQTKAAEAALKRQQAKEASQKLREDNKRVGVQNDLDNIKPGGGFRGLIYERTGLLPDQQDSGALAALAQGKITPEQFDAFLKSPDKLMQGNAGNALADRFAAMADEGRLTRDPNWKPAEPAPAPTVAAAPAVDAQGQPIRSMPAYQGGVAKNIARQLQLEKELDEIDPIVVVLADGSGSRASEMPDVYKMSDAERARSAAIRARLDAMKPTK